MQSRRQRDAPRLVDNVSQGCHSKRIVPNAAWLCPLRGLVSEFDVTWSLTALESSLALSGLGCVLLPCCSSEDDSRGRGMTQAHFHS